MNLRSTMALTLETVLGGIVVISALSAPWILFTAIQADRVYYTVRTDVGEPVPQGRLDVPAGTSVDWAGVIDVTISNPSTQLALLTALPSTIGTMAVSVVGYQLLRLLSSALTGVPFTGKESTRLRRAGACLVVAAVAITLISAAASARIIDLAFKSNALQNRDYWHYVDLRTLAFGLGLAFVCFVLAFAFDEGRRLTMDNEGLV